MPSCKPSIDLLVPGLLGPMPALRELDMIPRAPAVERCLSRATTSYLPVSDYSSTLFHLFGLSYEPQADLPTAPFCRMADGGAADAGFWLQATPVHLRPDGDGLLLFDAGVLAITQDEAGQLADKFRQHFSEMSWQLEVGSPDRWYLRLEQRPDLVTAPLVDVAGRNIDSYLPTGSESSIWHSILNEVQMLFHMSKVNMLREGRGELSINGIWLHGGGYLQPVNQVVFDSICADEPLVRGLAQCAGIESLPLPRTSIELLPQAGRRLVVADLFGRPVLDADPMGWYEALEQFDTWLEPLLAEVRARRLGHINLYPCNGSVYRVDAKALRRFWRSRPSIDRYLP